MKTKTITYHASLNYGSFFQAYALQQTIIGLGYDNEILDIQTPELKSNYELFRKSFSFTDVAKNLISILHYSSLKRRKEKFKKARREFLIMTKEYESLESYLNENKITDELFIAGSDQIWNTTASDFTSGYFLPGVKNKIAYSVSGGSHITLHDYDNYNDYINEFKSISVRENDLKKILQELGIPSVSVTLDPTLLLRKEDYISLTPSVPIIKERYIFLYSVKCEPEVMKFAAIVSKQTGLPIYTTFNIYRSEKNILYGFKTIYDAGPFEFLNIINNSEFVLSDSFHGNVFSILLEKEFYYISKQNKNGDLSRDDRIDGLLGALGLENRKVSNVLPFRRSIIEKSDKILSKISKMKSIAIDYLINALRGKS